MEADERVGGEGRLVDLHIEHSKRSEIVEDWALGKQAFQCSPGMGEVSECLLVMNELPLFGKI